MDERSRQCVGAQTLERFADALPRQLDAQLEELRVMGQGGTPVASPGSTDQKLSRHRVLPRVQEQRLLGRQAPLVAEALLDYYDVGVTTILMRGFTPFQDAIDYGRELIPLVRAELAQRQPVSGGF